MCSLIKELMNYSRSDYYGFHMPGHKRNIQTFGSYLPYAMDITEIEGFDDLHHAEEILLQAQKKASLVFKAEETHYLINGSTAGNLSAILSVTNVGDKVLVARNNHKSVYSALFLNHLNPIYIYPRIYENYGIMGEISSEDIEKCLQDDKDIKAIIIVSPTYDGVVSDVKSISTIAHDYGIPLIVDEAHGAHFGMHEYFPKNSNELGADLVVQSVHKTLPSLTQTGLLHVNGGIVDRQKLERYLKMFQSSSPSYVLMASIDNCVNLLHENGMELFKNYVYRLEKLRKNLGKLHCLKLIELKNLDRSKLLISTRLAPISSRELYGLLLEEYHLQMEMCGPDYITAMTSVGDTQEGFKRLEDALLQIDTRMKENGLNEDIISADQGTVLLPHMEQAECLEEGSQWFYYLYPPGIPFIVPGEIITEEIKQWMKNQEDAGFTIQRG